MRTFLLARDESRLIRWLRRFTVATALTYAMLATWGIVRRLWQIQHIELIAPSLMLAPGSTVGFDVIASGEVHNIIRLELIQGNRSAILAEQRAGVNSVNTLDPRRFRYQPTITITPELLAHFRAGNATLRVTGFGGRKLLRTPKARVRELQVQLVPPSATHPAGTTGHVLMSGRRGSARPFTMTAPPAVESTRRPCASSKILRVK